jgi:hypothetical protein
MGIQNAYNQMLMNNTSIQKKMFLALARALHMEGQQLSETSRKT